MNSNKLVEVLKIERTESGEIPVFGFSTYGWSKPSLFEKGKIKSGIYKDPFDDGTTRKNQSVNKTGEGEESFVIKDLHQVWECPIEIVGLNRSIANQLRNKFDARCNKLLSKYKVKTDRSQLIGEEWYRGISIAEIKSLRSNAWEELLLEYGSKPVEKKLTKIKPRGLQEPAIALITSAIERGVKRFKGIAPTGFGKTVVAFLSIVRLIQRGMIKNRIVIMTTPNQFLANKNAGSFNEMAERNGVQNIVNIPVFSGSDIGFNHNDISSTERREVLASIIRGHLDNNPKCTVVLHTCSHSMQLVDEVLDSIGISNIDFAICDEAHTLASTRDNRVNYILTDNLVKINHRFFLTATEKNLVNPDMLNESQVFNYMNNTEVFGDYVFQWSFADGVAEKHIVPMLAKVFEYTANNGKVAQTLKMFDALDIPELRTLVDEDGTPLLFDKKAARSITSVMSILGKEKRNKVLVLCSRNSHVTLLKNVFEAIKQNTDILEGVDVHDIKACDHTPAERQDLLDDIHDNDNRSIVITGPWAITGVDCPSIDSVFWNFTPGTEISVAQGTGRGTRTHEGKNNVLVCFNLDLENHLNILRSSISSTVLKLYEAQFPSHDVELKERVRRIVGRRFLSVEKDVDGEIPSTIRVALNEIYDAAESHDFTQILDSFRNRSTDSEIEKLLNAFIKKYPSNLIYLKEDLKKDFLQSKDMIDLINIKMTATLFYKVLERLPSEYKIIGRYTGLINFVQAEAYPLIAEKLLELYGNDFFGMKFIDRKSNSFKANFKIEFSKIIWSGKSFIDSSFGGFSAFVRSAYDYKYDKGLNFPAFGGKSKDPDTLRMLVVPVIVKELIKNDVNLSPSKVLEDFYKRIDEICVGDLAFIKQAFGKRTTDRYVRDAHRAEIGEDAYKKMIYDQVQATTKITCGEDYSGRKRVEWTDEKRKEKGKIFANLNKVKLKNRANNKKVKCPDGHVTSVNNYKRYCNSNNLSLEQCIFL